ncbi:MAG: crossover junction endodeoxyribonuclease RuvC [Patescibacteria group bacterium]
MVILGIDPGSSLIGYGAVRKDRGKFSCLEYGAIKIKAKETGLRLMEVRESLVKLIEKIKPDQVVLERLFFFKNRKTVLAVSETRGVIILTLSQRNIPYFEVAPLELKKSITSYGRASKGNVQKMVKLLLNLEKEPKPDDAADALALAILG